MALAEHRTVIGRVGGRFPDSDRRHDMARADPSSEDPFVSDWSDGSETAWAGEARRLERRHARALEEGDLAKQGHRGKST